MLLLVKFPLIHVIIIIPRLPEKKHSVPMQLLQVERRLNPPFNSNRDRLPQRYSALVLVRSQLRSSRIYLLNILVSPATSGGAC